MSHWYEADKEDLSLSHEKDELHIWLYSDDMGNVYASVGMDILLEFLAEKGLDKQDEIK
jgi:hypothetical protein